jgi:hypothetical protein
MPDKGYFATEQVKYVTSLIVVPEVNHYRERNLWSKNGLAGQ